MKGIQMRIKSLLPVICAAVFVFVMRTNAEVSGGIVLGSPSALTLKIDNTVILGVGGWGYGMILYADHWIIHKPIPTSSSFELNWYLGVGGELGVWNGYDPRWDRYYYYGGYRNDFFLGIRIPVGLQIPFEQRWEAFIEIVPVMSLFPFGPTANAGIGIRYTF